MKLAESRSRQIPAAGTTQKENGGSPRLPSERAARNTRESESTQSLPKRAGDILRSCQTGGDRFYLNSLVGQIWLVQLREYTEARYGEPVGANGRGLQTGFAWRSFCKVFEPLSAIELVRLFENLLRFANYEAYAPARAFFLAYAPLAFEHDASGEYIGPGVWTPKAGSRSDAALRVKRTFKRWCQWLEALVHFQVHDLRHPASAHRDLDKRIILLWPLVKRHNWTYLDLLKVLRSVGHCDASFPCPSARQLAEYCQTVLGLRTTSRRTTPKASSVQGKIVAERLCKFLPSIC